ncbi:MAG TPA: hypothetical protein VKA60_08730 [Blastocatellia bacterium]|nr:hypothetical protein [Blastocatellia bacterium]
MLLLALQSLNQLAAQPEGASNDIVREYLTNPFVIVIWAVFLVGVIGLVRYLLRLPAQYRALERTHKNYGHVVKTGETDAEVIRGELLKEVDRHSVPAQRVEELHWISVHGGDFDQVALSEVLAAREVARTSFARYGASILVLLGLCGAVYGLSNVVVRMGPELREVQEQLTARNASPAAEPGRAGQPAADSRAPIQDSFGRLLKTMSLSLVHTRNAFYASLTGILLSILLLFLNWSVNFAQVRFLTQLEDMTATKLIPIFKPLPKEYELAGALDSFKEGSNYLVRLSDDLDSKMAQVGGGLDNLFTIVRKFGEGADALHSSQERVYEAQEQMMQVVEQFVGLTSRIENNQDQTRQNIEDVLTAVREGNRNLSRAIEEWKGKHESVLLELQRAFNQAHVETKDVRETSRTWIKETNDLIRDSFDRQLDTFNRQSLELLERQQESNRDHLTKVIEDQSTFVFKLQEAVANSDGHRDLVEGMASAIREERRTFSENLERLLASNKGVMQRMLEEQRKLVDVTGLRNVERGMESFALSTQKQFADMLKVQQEFAQQIGTNRQQVNSLNSLIKTLIVVAVVAIPVFAVLAVMFIFNLQPTDRQTQVFSFIGILAMIAVMVWALRTRI